MNIIFYPESRPSSFIPIESLLTAEIASFTTLVLSSLPTNAKAHCRHHHHRQTPPAPLPQASLGVPSLSGVSSVGVGPFPFPPPPLTRRTRKPSKLKFRVSSLCISNHVSSDYRGRRVTRRRRAMRMRGRSHPTPTGRLRTRLGTSMRDPCG